MSAQIGVGIFVLVCILASITCCLLVIGTSDDSNEDGMHIG